MLKLASRLTNGWSDRFIEHARSPLYFNAYALTLSDGATAALGVLYWILAARYYTAQEVGLDSAAIATMMSLSSLSFLCIRSVLIRFIPQAGAQTARLVTIAYLASLLLALVSGLIFLGGYRLFINEPGFFGGDAEFAIWFLLSSMAWCIFALQDGVLTGLRQAIWVPVSKVTYGVLKLGLVVWFAALLPQHGIFMSWIVVVPLLVLLVNILIFRRLIKRHVAATREQAVALAPRQLLRFAGGEYFASLFQHVTVMLLPIIVLNQAGASANAYFYLAWIIALPLMLFSVNMAMALTVEGASDDSQLAYHTRRAMLQMGRLLAPVVLVVLIGAEWVLYLFGADYASEGGMVLRLLALSALPYSLNGVFMSVSRVRKQVGQVILIEGAVSVLVLSLTFLLLPRFGITGVGIAWLAGQSIVAATLVLTRFRSLIGAGAAPVGPSDAGQGVRP